MTLVVGWMGFDSNGASSLHLVSDSLYTIQDASGQVKKSEFGQKIFVSKCSPDIFAFCGVVRIGFDFLTMVIDKIESKVGFSDLNFQERSEFILQELNGFIKKSNYSLTSTKFIHGGRDDRRLFYFHAFVYDKNKNEYYIESNKIKSVIINGKDKHRPTSIGSGSDIFETHLDNTLANIQSNVRTSRLFFQLFIEVLEGKVVNDVGGPAQIGSLYTKDNGLNVGYIDSDKLYFQGVEFKSDKSPFSINTIKWINRNFENCNFNTKLRQEKAQMQPHFKFPNRS